MNDEKKSTEADNSEEKAIEEPIVKGQNANVSDSDSASSRMAGDLGKVAAPDNAPSAGLGNESEKQPDAGPNNAGADKPSPENTPAHAQHAKVAKSSKGKIIGVVIAIVAIIAIVAVCVVMFSNPAAEEAPQSVLVEESSATEAAPEDNLPESPIDWAEWQERNNNVYAWVSVPDTGIELPVLQHPVVENYYLEHDIDGNSTIAGAIYSQKTYNSKDFQDDPVTVLYGHTFETNDTMFTNLHMLEDEVFFDEHPNFYIYTPEYNLTYEIISAYEWDNKLILAKWDTHNLDKQQEYFDLVADPESTNKNVRAMDRLIAGEDHIVQLSTCTVPSNSNKRYLVTGVLVGAERVKSNGVGLSDEGEVIVQQ